MMSEERTNIEREIEQLMREQGLSREYAERVMADEDLWLLIPEQRFAFLEGEQDLRQWGEAHDFATSLADGFDNSEAINDATRQLLWEMRERAEEALRRARRRAGG